jgi:SulP family sulfate permease
MVMAALLYIVKVTGSTTVARVTPEHVEAGFAHSLQTNPLPDGLAAYLIHGPFLFGAADKLGVFEQDFDSLPAVVMLRLRNMAAIDATGLHALENLAERLLASGRHLILCGMRAQPAKLMTQADFQHRIGGENSCVSLKDAVERARELLKLPRS